MKYSVGSPINNKMIQCPLLKCISVTLLFNADVCIISLKYVNTKLIYSSKVYQYMYEVSYYGRCTYTIACLHGPKYLEIYYHGIMTYSGDLASDNRTMNLLSPAAPKARDGRYCNTPRPSVRPSICPSVTFSFRTVTQKLIDVFSRNFAGTCTMSWGCAV